MRGAFRLYAGSRDYLASGVRPLGVADLNVIDQSIVEIAGPGTGDSAGVAPVADRGVVHGRASWKENILRIEVQPDANIRHHVVAQGDVTRSFIEVEGDPSGNVVDVVFGYQGAGVGRQVIDGAAIGKPTFDVVHAVGDYDAVAKDGRRVISDIARLVIISPVGGPIGGAAARIVGTPTPTDVDPVVGSGGDVVIHDYRCGGIGHQDRGLFTIVLRHVFNDVVANEDIADTHFRARWMVGLVGYAADHDCPAGEVDEAVAQDVDRGRAEPDTAQIGIRVVADSERYLPQVAELVVGEDDAARGGNLDGGGLLTPMIAGGLKCPTT